MHDSPRAAAQALADAMAAGDEGAAQTASTKSGWEGGGESLSGLFNVAKTQGLGVELCGQTHTQGDRAVQYLQLAAPGKPTAKAWLHLVEAHDRWRAAGWTFIDNVAGLFLAGKIEALPNWGALIGPSDDARAYAERIVAALKGGESELDDASSKLLPRLQRMMRTDGSEVEILRTGALESIGRSIAGFKFTQPGKPFAERWIIRDESGAALAIVPRPDIAAFVHGHTFERDKTGEPEPPRRRGAR